MWVVNSEAWFLLIVQLTYIFLQIRLVVEEGLNQLPYNSDVVVTPTGEANLDLPLIIKNNMEPNDVVNKIN